MRILRRLVVFGMVGVISFLLLTNLGRILWVGYNPVTMYISALIANEAPNSQLMRLFMDIYNICLFVFCLVMTVYSFDKYHNSLKIGYSILLAASLVSLLGYGNFPISLEFIFSSNDIIHLAVTLIILTATVFSLIIIAHGYLKQEKYLALGRASLMTSIFFAVFNLWHLYAILHGQNILGLIERLTFYTFHAFTFFISWIYTFKFKPDIF